MSGLVHGRPGRRCFEPSYFWATSFRYHRRMVSGVTMPATVREAAPAEDLAFHGQTASLVVGEVQRSRTVGCEEDAVLLTQVIDDVLLVSVDPAGDKQEEESQRRRQRVHPGSMPIGSPRFNGLRRGTS